MSLDWRGQIEDWHGTKVEVDVVYKSAGAFVYLELESDYARLTPEQAVTLADRLKAAAEDCPS